MDLISKDQKFIWHPFTQEKTAPAPLLIEKGEGCYLWTKDGRKIFDAISSWWVTLHGHCHPVIVERIHKQLQTLEQVIFADMTHEPAILLGERVLGLLPAGFARLFFSDNGSTAVEVGLKIALQYWHNRGAPRKKIVAFRHSYHGDTFGAMAVSARSEFTSAFHDKLFDVLFIDPPLRGEKPEHAASQLAELADRHKDIAAVIYEPLVQGAGGMLMQDAEALNRCLQVAKENGILCIADEVMTGFGRTGKIFASDHLSEKPDIICMAKGLTGGTLPLSATACTEKIYEAFLSEDKLKAFFHGHSFTANPAGCAAAHASLDLLELPETLGRIETVGESHKKFRESLVEEGLDHHFKDIRQQGTILACEVRTDEDSGYFNSLRDKMAVYFRDQGVLLRPLGNVLYCLPPFCSQPDDLELAYSAIRKFLREEM